MPDGTPQGPEGDRIETTVRAVLATMAGDLTAKESVLLAELEGLGRTIARAKAEIAALKVEDIRDAHIPSATDELDLSHDSLSRHRAGLPAHLGAAVNKD